MDAAQPLTASTFDHCLQLIGTIQSAIEQADKANTQTRRMMDAYNDQPLDTAVFERSATSTQQRPNIDEEDYLQAGVVNDNGYYYDQPQPVRPSSNRRRKSSRDRNRGDQLQILPPVPKPPAIWHSTAEPHDWHTLLMLAPLCFGGLLLLISQQLLLGLTHLAEHGLHDMWQLIWHNGLPQLLDQLLADEQSLFVRCLSEPQLRKFREIVQRIGQRTETVRLLMVVPFAVLLWTYVGMWMVLQLNTVMVQGVPADRVLRWLEESAPQLAKECATLGVVRY